MILVTGGAGFIGSNFILDWMGYSDEAVVNLDCLTYAGNLRNLDAIAGDSRHMFVRGDIRDDELVESLLHEHAIRAIVHFAAESHVDRSIRGPEDFIQTNVLGTFRLLEAARRHWESLGPGDRADFRFIHVSTDEVYGSLGPSDPPFIEASPFRPNSPYAASKAAADHLARSHHHTYGLPVVVTNCSNNYGPFQFPEKLIPLCIHNALAGGPLPIYGDGRQVRDWLHVQDHCAALRRVLDGGLPGETYAVGGGSERANIDVVRTLCAILDEERPRDDGRSYAKQIEHVKDRPGHDRRYAVDAAKIRIALGWAPQETFESGLRKTVRWYLSHGEWVADVTSGGYREWIERHYV